MEGSSSQSGSSSTNTASENNDSISYKTGLHENIFNNSILLKLKEDGFITPDEMAKELIKELSEIKYLYALKVLFENLKNEFSPQSFIKSLEALIDHTSFNYYSKESVPRLELHLRTWVTVLERICFSPIVLSKKLRDDSYSSLAKFAKIHRNTTQVIERGLDNNFRSKFNQLNQQNNSQDEQITIKKRNYNIDFLLIHLRDTLHSLRDDETWFQEIIRRTKDFLKGALNITPGILSAIGLALPNDNCSILSLLTQIRKSLSFKYPVASYYVDWRIMLIIQHNIFNWSDGTEMIISKKFSELVLMEYFWSFLEREWINISDKSIIDSQTKFDKVSDKVVKALNNTGDFLNDLARNEPIALPHTLWFGILDLAQNLIQRSTRIATYGLCYYLAIESLNKAPSSFIQFKSIELLLHLYNIDNEMFSMIEIDFDQYAKKLNENNLTDSSENFRNLLTFVKEKYLEDLKILSNDTGKGKEGKGKGLNQNSNFTILDIIAVEITCPISSEPMDQLCILKCLHILSLNNLKKLKQKICPNCRENIEDNDIRYLPQNAIYKNLYTKFFESGHILPSIENSGQIIDNQYDSDDLDNSEVDLILTKKNKFMNSITKLNTTISISSILPKFTKKQHPTYQIIIKEINEKHYEKAESLCKEFLNFFPKSYSLRCILSYIYRCLNKYEQAFLYLEEAFGLNFKKPVAYFICGEIYYRQNEFEHAINNLRKSLDYKAKSNNLYIILGNSYLFATNYYNNYYNASVAYNIALKSDPNNYLCLKNYAYIYKKQGNYLNALKILDKLLNVNKEDSLVLCYYGEILYNMTIYSEAIINFTKAYTIDPENTHNLNKRAIAYYILQEYDNLLSDLDKVIQLDPFNSSAYYLKSLTYYTKNDINNATISFKKYTESLELSKSDNILAKTQSFHLEYLLYKNSTNDLKNILTNTNQNITSICDGNILLYFIRCKIFIELKEYFNAKVDLDNILFYKFGFINFFIQDSDFWTYLYKVCKIDKYDVTKFGISDKFSKYMYKEKRVYLISNLTNLEDKLCQFQENDVDSLSGQVLCSKNEKLHFDLPNLYYGSYSIWKINIKEILSKDCFIKFIVKDESDQKEYMLKYDDLSKFEGLGWIEYQSPIFIYSDSQLSFEVNFIELQIDYIRFVYEKNGCKITQVPIMRLMGCLLPDYHQIFPNIPETFKDKYFSRKEMENLLGLKDILDNL